MSHANALGIPSLAEMPATAELLRASVGRQTLDEIRTRIAPTVVNPGAAPDDRHVVWALPRPESIPDPTIIPRKKDS